MADTVQIIKVRNPEESLRELLGYATSAKLLFLPRTFQGGESPPEDDALLDCTDRDEGVTIVPCRTELPCVWSLLPWPLPALVASPFRTAAVAVNREALEQTNPRHTLWQFLSDVPPESVTIANRTEALGDESQLPLLRPAETTIPMWLRSAIFDCVPTPAESPVHLAATRAGLLQMHDQLDASHALAQGVQGKGRDRPGDYWHAIMHRREGDFDNAKHWLGNVGEHPIYPDLSAFAHSVLEECAEPEADQWRSHLVSGGWDPRAFVDFCSACAREESSDLSRAARRIQWAEMVLLVADNVRRAMGDA